MKTIVYKSDSRGSADHGWLKARHSFSFAGYHDPSRVHFGLLRVLNDDIVAGGMGFGSHPHDNMEIVTIPLSGALQHKDNTGRGEIIRSGDVQIMSAGTGIVHSEKNASATEPVNLLQIWVFPEKENIEPRYEQKTFDVSERKNKFQTVVSPDKKDDALWINQQSWFTLADQDAEQTLNYKLHKPGNGVYLFVIKGAVEAAQEKLDQRDAVGVVGADEILIKATKDSQLLLIEVPMN